MARKQNGQNGQNGGQKTGSKVRVMMLGGLNEIGKNLAVIEYENDMIIIDCGLAFPDEDMLGVDLVIPDFTYLEKNASKIRGILITHGHEDHIGGLPYLLKELDVPVYGTRLTLGILESKLAEHRLLGERELVTVEAGTILKLGVFKCEFIRVNHSIADACMIAVRTPEGTILHTGDFKLDVSPIGGEMMDLTRIGEYGREGILLLMCESTNVEKPGFTPSERKVGASLDMIFMTNTDKRIIIATFSSNVHRVQQIINSSAKFGRKVAVTGRSMLNVVGAAVRLGYMEVPKGVLIDIADINRYPREQITIVTTGSQGEPMSALYRMAFADHSQVELTPNDLVVLSSHAIPGNEKLVGRIINEMYKKGVNVYHDEAVVHVSGHACQEELKLIHALTKPKFFMPIHGEYHHLMQHKELAEYMGMDPANIFVCDIGQVLELDRDSCKRAGTVPSGRMLVDGYGVGDVGNIVLRDRRHLAQDGLIVVVATVDIDEATIISGPDIISRGFVYVRECEELMDEVREIVRRELSDALESGVTEWTQMKTGVKDALSKYLYSKTKRKPMILPVIMNV
ncbi:MAG: ribonuclease J [Eubacteriales bacterium]|nr:ribonuclease J [Eubacteriales bacterium]MDY3942377.1 ribonuclease J [Eubacteriales bacterium]